MKFIIRNQARISNKYVRFAKWKIRALDAKFKSLIYSEIFIKKEGRNPEYFYATVKLGVPGPDIIITSKSSDLKHLWSGISKKINRQMSKYSERSKH